MKFEVSFNLGIEAFLIVESKNKQEALSKANDLLERMSIGECHLYNYDYEIGELEK